MSSAERDLSRLLSGLEPVLNEGVYVYVVVPPEADISAFSALAAFPEQKG
jgi:hypothetical protein